MARRSYGEYMADVFANPMVERFQKRKVRRGLLLTEWLLYLAIISTCLAIPEAWWLWGPLCLALFPVFSCVNMSVRGVTDSPLGNLDEWQAQQRLKAYHDAFWIGLILAFGSGFALYHLWHSGVYTQATVFAMAPILGVIWGGLVGIPSNLLAWRLPDESAEEA